MNMDNEIMELPKGWIVEELGNIADKITKGATPTTYGYKFQKSGINFIKIQNVFDGNIDLTTINDFISEEAHKNQKKSILKVDDVLFSIDGTICETTIIKESHLPANTNQAFAIISGFSYLLLPKYLEFQLRSFISQKTKEKARGGAMNNVSLSDLSHLELLLPPPPEQHRIVAKIEALFSELDKGVESLKTAREQLKIYRQALLKHAFSGKLTEQWRADRKSASASASTRDNIPLRDVIPDVTETAEALLQRIQTEREQRYQQQLNDWETTGKQGTKLKAPKTLPPLTAEELAELPELPEGWAWMKVGEISDVQLGRQRSPNNRSNNYPTKYIRAGNLTENGLNLDDVLDMEFEPQDKERFLLAYGDVLLSEASGSANQVGKPAIWHNEIEQCCFQNTVIRVRSISLSEYLFWVFKTF